MTISQMMLPEYDNEMKSTRKMLECVPDENLGYKPHEKSMTLGRLAGHVAELPGWIPYTINMDSLELTPDMKPLIATSREQLLAAFDKNSAEGRASLEGAGDECLMAPWSLIIGGHKAFTMPRAAVLRSMVMNHVIHHRAQLGVYLRLNNIAIPGSYGPSADDKH